MELLFNGKNNQGVKKQIFERIYESEDTFIITGFSSLEFFADFIKGLKKNKTKKVRLLLGNDFSDLEGYDNKKLAEITESYWKNRRFSISSIKAIKNLQDILYDEDSSDQLDEIQVRIDKTNKTQHSKIYLTDEFAMIGSSNFSKSGFMYQKETNVLIEKTDPKFQEIKDVSEFYWEQGTDFKDELLNILERILSILNYLHVLKIIHDEYLMGKWFNGVDLNKEVTELWPHQKMTVAESLVALDNIGSVIIAEPTGSGKTKASTNVLRVLYNKYICQGYNSRATFITVIAPPRVEDEWRSELATYGIYDFNFISSGKLSNNSEDNKLIVDQIKKSSILLIDEAHTYRNINNKGAQVILKNNNSDYMILLTATPINKQLNDYFGFTVLIGADSIDKRFHKGINRVLRTGKKYSDDLSEEQLTNFKKSIQPITVRKTKKDINKIARAHNIKEYPKENTKTYDVVYSKEDLLVLKQITSKISQISGLSSMPKQPDLHSREAIRSLNKFRGLSQWYLKYYLRSSKAAFIEHLKGTMQAFNDLNMAGMMYSKNTTSSRIEELKQRSYYTIQRGDTIANVHINAKFLYHPEEYKERMKIEQEIYDDLYSLALQLSDEIDNSKIEIILKTLKTNNKVVIFDAVPISVMYFDKKIKDALRESDITDVKVLYATGSDGRSARDEIKTNLGGNSDQNERVLVIASNVLSESVNLQSAGVEIFLDIPLTPIVGEQRIGRIARMNSKHNEIDIYWPKYERVLLLNSDIMLGKRFKTIADTIKGNVMIPEYLMELSQLEYDDSFESEIDPDNGFTEFENDNLGMEDLLKDLRYMFYDKNDELRFQLEEIPKHTKIETAYSFIRTDSNWGLFYVQDTNTEIPSLYFIDYDDDKKVINDLSLISEKFLTKMKTIEVHNDKQKYEHVIFEINQADLKDQLNDYEETMADNFKERLLNNKEKGLITLLEKALHYQVLNPRKTDIEKSGYIEILENLKDDKYDKKIVSKNWYSLIQDYWSKHLSIVEKRKERLPVYEDLLPELKNNMPSSEKLYDVLTLNSHKKDRKFIVRAAILSFKK